MNPQGVYVSWQLLLALYGGGATVATAIWWSAFLLGKIWSRLERTETAIKDMRESIDEMAEAMRHLRRERMDERRHGGD